MLGNIEFEIVPTNYWLQLFKHKFEKGVEK